MNEGRKKHNLRGVQGRGPEYLGAARAPFRCSGRTAETNREFPIRNACVGRFDFPGWEADPLFERAGHHRCSPDLALPLALHSLGSKK
jgi:hypothetical protein